MSHEVLEDRKIPQSFGLGINQIVKLRERSKETGRSLSDLAREAIDSFLTVKESHA